MALDKGHEDSLDELVRSSNMQHFQTRETADPGDVEEIRRRKKMRKARQTLRTFKGPERRYIPSLSIADCNSIWQKYRQCTTFT